GHALALCYFPLVYVYALLDSHLFVIIYGIYLFVTFFFFNDPPPTDIYTLSLHDALPIWGVIELLRSIEIEHAGTEASVSISPWQDRKSTRLNSSHQIISYAVFCLKKKQIPSSQVTTLPPCPTTTLTDVLRHRLNTL